MNANSGKSAVAIAPPASDKPNTNEFLVAFSTNSIFVISPKASFIDLGAL